MHEFDKCNFCSSRVVGEGYSFCSHPFCEDRSDYALDVNKIFNKADELNISITDLFNLIRECTKE